MSACPVSSCSSRASRRALELLRVDDAAQRVAGDPLGEVDGDGGACGERLGEPQVLVGEARVARRRLSCAAIDADRPVARRAAARRGPASHPERRARSPGRPRGRRSSSRPARCGAARARGRSSSRARRGRSRGALRRRAPSAASTRSVAVAGGQRDQRRAARRPARAGARRPGRAAAAARARPTSALPTSFSDSSWRSQRVADSYSRAFSIATAACAASSVTSSSSSSVKSSPPRLLGQVEVAVGDAAQQDRDAEEGPHRRVVRREADRARIVGRGRAGGAAARRRSGRRGCRARAAGRRSPRASPASIPVVRKRSSAAPRAVDHAERRVARAGQLGGGLDDLLQDARRARART